MKNIAFDFDQVIDRSNTNSMKWDEVSKRYNVSKNAVMPMWVADMDFRPPDSVTEALENETKNHVHGYYGAIETFHEAQKNWFSSRHNWLIDEEWRLLTHGLLNAISLSIQSLSSPGDGIIVFTPVYYQFMEIIKNNDRSVVESTLKVENNRFVMDLKSLEKSLSGNEKIVLFCSPHNPGGRVWEPKELEELAEFCIHNQLLLISDEVHHDLVMPHKNHIIMAKAAPAICENLITLVSTSKTFNIAGTETGTMFIPNPDIKEKVAKALLASGVSTPNRFGMIMSEAAYLGGHKWLDDLIVYLNTNRVLLNETITSIPGMSVMDLEATYLGWVNFSATGLSAEEVNARLHKKGVVPSVGSTFGVGGTNCFRINIACRHAFLNEAMQRVTEAFSDLQ